ncbi:ascorbate-specific PTS system EIIC-type component UlaA [Halomonas campaniensis]|jgi:hypothetical protein|uniref:Ascorbate-specific PTS system EIIC-type component UlaA n=1 Tax=Halomonas campaniensis TaxID=213554 RepID=A0A7W5K1Z0_9GAMM|nr:MULTISPECIES: hypothetical protein [Halomonas]MBB3330341.1 ascorbate-specific PTS system EIIC-type component UlaA [Halomonas campaniensis]
MSPQHFLEMATFTFNLVGLVVCIGGLTLAHRTRHRVPGYLLAGLGFLIAASPVLYPLIATPAP